MDNRKSNDGRPSSKKGRNKSSSTAGTSKGKGRARKNQDKVPRLKAGDATASTPTATTSTPTSTVSGPPVEMIVNMVETIKSGNPNHGGGRKAAGGAWMAEEDEALRLIVNRDGSARWISKATELNSRMAPLYQLLTSAALSKGETPVAYGRVASQCLHRWKKVLQPGVRKGHWTKIEDAVLTREFTKSAALGMPMKWSGVAALIPGRLGKQCRERWFNHLDPSLKKTPWTGQEDDILFNALRFFGRRWCEIEKFLPGRTANAIKNRANSSIRQKWHRFNAKAAPAVGTSKPFLDMLKATFVKFASRKARLENAQRSSKAQQRPVHCALPPSSSGHVALHPKQPTAKQQVQPRTKSLKRPTTETEATNANLSPEVKRWRGAGTHPFPRFGDANTFASAISSSAFSWCDGGGGGSSSGIGSSCSSTNRTMDSSNGGNGDRGMRTTTVNGITSINTNDSNTGDRNGGTSSSSTSCSGGCSSCGNGGASSDKAVKSWRKARRQQWEMEQRDSYKLLGTPPPQESAAQSEGDTPQARHF